jgi:hypothetical protein
LLSSTPGIPTYRDLEDDPLDDDEPIEEPISPGEAGRGSFPDVWDDGGAEVTTRLSNLDGPEWDWLEEHVVDEAMSRAPLLPFRRARLSRKRHF